MREYVNVRPTGVLLRATTQIMLVRFFTFPGNSYASRPNYFDSLFCQRYIVFVSFA